MSGNVQDDDATPAEPAGATEPADAAPTAGAGAGDGFDDDIWSDAPGTPKGPNQAVRIAQIGLVALAVLIVGVVLIVKTQDDDGGSSKESADPGASTTVAPGPAKEAWPAAVGGRPAALGERGQLAPQVTVAPGTAPGIYIWNDFDGWHMWSVGGAELPEVSGTMQSSDAISQADLAVPGVGTVEKNDKVATFTIPAGVPLGGIDFNPGFFGKSMTFTLNGPDGPIDPALVHLGANAEQAPFPLTIAYGPQP